MSEKIEYAREQIEEIRRLSRNQDAIFESLVKFLGIEDDEMKTDWLHDAAFNDAAFNDADFNKIWEEKIC